MTNYKFLLTLFFTILFCACSDEGDSLVGTWSLSNVTLTSCPDDIPEMNINATNGCVSLVGENLCLEMEFTEDERIIVTSQFDNEAPDIQQGTYTDNSSTIEICFSGDCQDLTLNDNTLILSGEEEGCDISYSFIKQE